MKILYGVQTTGHGHIVRSMEMIQSLRELGHEVYTLFSGEPKKRLWNTQIFEPFEVKRGLTFVTRQGKIDYIKTIKQLNFFRFYYDIFSYQPDQIDLVITDYEPITARIAKRNNIFSIGIGHLYAFSHEVPIAGSNPVSRWVMDKFAPVDCPLGLHWHHFHQPILPPTIPRHVQYNGQPISDKILVYFPFESLEETIAFLRSWPDFTFYVYCNIDSPDQKSHIKLRPYSRESFVKDLAECNGVICNAGFSLVSEALHLGKKVLVKPVAGQLEQQSNALALKELGLGTVMQKMDPELTRFWLETDSPEPKNYPDVLQNLANWIDKGCWDQPEELVQKIWN